MTNPKTPDAESGAKPAGSGPIPIKRGELTGFAAATYVPRRGRGARHYEDPFSWSLWICKVDPDLGRVWAFDHAKAVAELVPEGTELIACPPPGRRRSARGWYLAEALAAAVARRLDLPLARPLRWIAEGAEASKDLARQGGKGRALARQAVCDEDLTGVTVCVVDDLFTTGITVEKTAEALREAGAVWPVGIATLGATERTETRPDDERDRIKQRARRKRARREVTP